MSDFTDEEIIRRARTAIASGAANRAAMLLCDEEVQDRQQQYADAFVTTGNSQAAVNASRFRDVVNELLTALGGFVPEFFCGGSGEEYVAAVRLHDDCVLGNQQGVGALFEAAHDAADAALDSHREYASFSVDGNVFRRNIDHGAFADAVAARPILAHATGGYDDPVIATPRAQPDPADVRVRVLEWLSTPELAARERHLGVRIALEQRPELNPQTNSVEEIAAHLFPCGPVEFTDPALWREEF